MPYHSNLSCCSGDRNSTRFCSPPSFCHSAACHCRAKLGTSCFVDWSKRSASYKSASANKLDDFWASSLAILDSGSNHHYSGCRSNFSWIGEEDKHKVELFVADRKLDTPGFHGLFHSNDGGLARGIFH